MGEALTPFSVCHPGQSARASARDDLIRDPYQYAVMLTDRMGPGSALRLAGMTAWSAVS